MNAIKFLINEHNRVRKMLAEISSESHREATKQRLFKELCYDLQRHEAMEQAVWYPFLKKQFGEIVGHLITEEKEAAQLIKEFKKEKFQAAWKMKFNKLKHDVKHHANEEEQKLFPKVAKAFTEAELEMLGKKMLYFKREYEHKKAA